MQIRPKSYRRPAIAFFSVFLGLTASVYAGAPVVDAESAAKAEPGVLIEQHKKKLMEAFKGFVKAAEIRFGDEGTKVWRSIGSMEQALADWDGAIRALEASLASKPADAGDHVLLAKVYLDRGRVAGAIGQAAAAVRLDPSRAEAYLLEGMAHDLAGKPAEAVEAFRKAISLDPEEPTASYRLAQSLMNLGREEEARKALADFASFQQKRLSKEPPSAAPARLFPTRFKTIEGPLELLPQFPPPDPYFGFALYKKGFAHLTKRNYEQAIASFRDAAAIDPLSKDALRPERLDAELEAARRAVAEHPEDAEKNLRLGEVHLALNQREEARRAFEQALKLDGTLSHARLHLARLALRDGKPEAARNHLTAVLERDGSFVEARRLLGLVHWADGQKEKAVEEYRAAIRLSPYDERLRMAFVGLLVSAGRTSEAEPALTDAIAAMPDSGQAHYNLARLYHSLGRHNEALGKLQDALAFEPFVGLYQIHARTAHIYSRQVKLDDAIEAYRKALDANLNEPHAHRELAQIYLKRNRYDEALAEFMAVLVIDPQSSDTYVNIAQIHLRKGAYAEAVEASRRALALDPRYDRPRYILGNALIRLGKTEEGNQELQKFQQLQARALEFEHRRREIVALKQEAAASIDKGELDNAIALLRKAIEYQPSAPAAHIDLARALIKAGRGEEAIQSLRKAQELKAESPEIHQYLAEAYKLEGRLEESEKEHALYTRLREEQLRRRGETP